MFLPDKIIFHLLWLYIACCDHQHWAPQPVLNQRQSYESWNHRMAWFGRDLKYYLVPTRLPWAGLPTSRSRATSCCPGTHAAWPWAPPGTLFNSKGKFFLIKLEVKSKTTLYVPPKKKKRWRRRRRAYPLWQKVMKVQNICHQNRKDKLAHTLTWSVLPDEGPDCFIALFSF